MSRSSSCFSRATNRQSLNWLPSTEACAINENIKALRKAKGFWCLQVDRIWPTDFDLWSHCWRNWGYGCGFDNYIPWRKPDAYIHHRSGRLCRKLLPRIWIDRRAQFPDGSCVFLTDISLINKGLCDPDVSSVLFRIAEKRRTQPQEKVCLDGYQYFKNEVFTSFHVGATMVANQTGAP